jgi:SAM-dependent methyltransferase
VKPSGGALLSEVFGPAYADLYNLVYSNKDYAAECDLIEGLFRRYSNGSISSVLDLGCGTGNHVFPLSRSGYEVVGVERSQNMLALAQRKLAENRNNVSVRLEHGDIRNVDLGRKFDAALMMFAVLGYQLENSDVLSALKTARRHLEIGGLLIFDVWYGPAVLHQKPSERIATFPTKDGKILRVASGKLDVSRQICTVKFLLWQLAGERLVAETEETHLMRYFFPLELNLLLDCSGFTLVRVGAFPDFENQPDETTWSVLAVARAV